MVGEVFTNQMTSKNKERIPARERRITINISMPMKILFKIDEECEPGKRSEYISTVLQQHLGIP